MDEYTAFISYSTLPDYKLARHIESFLEGFHKSVKKLPNGSQIPPLNICMDGSDFNLNTFREKGTSEVEIINLINQYLDKSAYLIVLCSTKSAKSKYVEHELEYFIKQKGVNNIFLAITDAKDPQKNPELYFPRPVINAGMHRLVYFDFRAWYKHLKNEAVGLRDFEDAKVNLASQLHGFAPGELYPIWAREEKKRLIRQRTVTGIAAIIFLVLGIISITLFKVSQSQQRELESELFISQSKVIADKRMDLAIEYGIKAIETKATNKSYGNLLNILNAYDNLISIFQGHKSKINKIKFIDDTTLISIGADNWTKFYNVNELDFIHKDSIRNNLPNSFILSSGINSIAFQGLTDFEYFKSIRSLIITSSNGEIYLGKIVNDTLSFELIFTHDAPIFSMSTIDVNPNNIDFIIGDDFGKVVKMRWGNDAIEILDIIKTHEGPVYDVVHLHREKMIVTAGGDGKAVLWDEDMKIRIDSLVSEFNGPFYRLEYHPTKPLIAAGGDFSKVKLWDVQNDSKISLGPHQDRINDIAFHPELDFLIVAASNLVYMYDYSRSDVPNKSFGHTEPISTTSFQQVSSIAIAPDGETFISAGNDGKLIKRGLKIFQYENEFYKANLVIPRHCLAEFVHLFNSDTRLLLPQAVNRSLIVKKDSSICSIEIGSMTEKWKRRCREDLYDLTILNNEYLFYPSLDSSLHLINVLSGKTSSTIKIDSGFKIDLILPFANSFSWIQTSSNKKEQTKVQYCSFNKYNGDINCDSILLVDTRIIGAAIEDGGMSILLSLDQSRVFGSNLIRLTLEDFRVLPLSNKLQYPIEHFKFIENNDTWVTATAYSEMAFRPKKFQDSEYVPFLNPHEYSIQHLVDVPEKNMFISEDGSKICFWDTKKMELIGCISLEMIRGIAVDGNHQLYYIGSDRFLYKFSLDLKHWKRKATSIINN